MTRYGRLSLLIISLFTVGCGGPTPQYAQGYESPTGYMQPDHSYLYYWMLYHSTMGMYQPQPVYHVYMIPPGYPSDYRPWRANEYARDTSGRFVRRPPAATPARTSGGFSQPAQSQAPSRTSGGFSRPAPIQTPASRTSGEFSPPAVPASTPATRTSGGFDQPKTTPPASSAPRASGGFSRPTPSASPRSSGGFSKKK
jgi:hypothetical protein